MGIEETFRQIVDESNSWHEQRIVKLLERLIEEVVEIKCDQMNDIISYEEAARYFPRVPKPKTISNWKLNGYLPDFAIKERGIWMYHWQKLKRWMDKNPTGKRPRVMKEKEK